MSDRQVSVILDIFFLLEVITLRFLCVFVLATVGVMAAAFCFDVSESVSVCVSGRINFYEILEAYSDQLYFSYKYSSHVFEIICLPLKSVLKAVKITKSFDF